MMKRNLKKSEKMAIYIAGAIIVLIILWIVWINPTRSSIDNLRKVIVQKQNYLKLAQKYKQEYIAYEAAARQYSSIIETRPKDFSLKQYVANIEGKLNFLSSIQRPESTKKLGLDYLKTTIDYTYNGKSLQEIINYLYELEDPQYGIGITNFELKPNADGKKFDLRRISLSVVTKVMQ